MKHSVIEKKMGGGLNFGGIGAFIGHELTHGFEYEGRQYDAQGNLGDWWTAEDQKAFKERSQCLVDEYSNFVSLKDDKDPKNDVHLNGKLTLGENTADNGGLRIAYMALEDTLAGKSQPKIDGFTPEQRLFLGWGQVWCMKMKPETARQRALTDPHSPGGVRGDGVGINKRAYSKADTWRKGEAKCRH